MLLCDNVFENLFNYLVKTLGKDNIKIITQINKEKYENYITGAGNGYNFVLKLNNKHDAFMSFNGCDDIKNQLLNIVSKTTGKNIMIFEQEDPKEYSLDDLYKEETDTNLMHFILQTPLIKSYTRCKKNNKSKKIN